MQTDKKPVRLSLSPENHRLIRTAAGCLGIPMSQFAENAVIEAARQRLLENGVLPAIITEKPLGEPADGTN